ncbi:MAG: DUF11 domain-containing protein [Lachnospiraceae bacterium]|nr:DUF11 domain-containing protein [Lachnospiraceae bacterium]
MKAKVKIAVIGAGAVILAAIIQSINNQNTNIQNTPTVNLSISNNINTETNDNELSEIIEEPTYDVFVSKPYDINDLDTIGLITVKVREYNGADTDWKDNIKIEKGQQIEFLIEYKNISKYDQEDVLISNILPENTKYIQGTAKMHNAINANGVEINSDELFSEKGINIGDYKPEANAFINFVVEVIDVNLIDGMRTLTNTVQCSVGADEEIVTEDYAYKILAGWGPERKLYTMESPARYPVFNSIIDNAAIGDERDFVRIAEKGSGNTFCSNIEIEANKQYEVFIYYHNNASSTFNDEDHDYSGVARNVRLSTFFPTSLVTGECGVVSAKISATNTDPEAIWDSACITAKEDMTLHYVTGSAKIYNRWEVNCSVLSIDLFSDEGTFLGINELNGIIPGCDEYTGSVIYIIQTRSIDNDT